MGGEADRALSQIGSRNSVHTLGRSSDWHPPRAAMAVRMLFLPNPPTLLQARRHHRMLTVVVPLRHKLVLGARTGWVRQVPNRPVRQRTKKIHT